MSQVSFGSPIMCLSSMSYAYVRLLLLSELLLTLTALLPLPLYCLVQLMHM
jgi:hypothetical protein